MKKHLLLLALLLSGISPAQALDVGDISSFMNSDSSTLSKTIKNSTDSGRLINIRLERLSSPLDDGQVIAMDKPDELLLTPASLLLPAQASEVIRFFYKGPADEKERYYRIVWFDQALSDAQRDNANRSAVATASARIGTILVVAPRQANYHFQYANGSLTNTGNATLRILAYGPCLKAANGSVGWQGKNIAASGRTDGNAGVIFNTGLEDDGQISAKINGRIFPLNGKRNYLPLSPYGRYEVELQNSKNSLDSYDIVSGRKSHLTLYPGNVAVIEPEVKQMVTVSGRIRAEDGTLLANARINNHIGRTRTDENGEFVMDVDKKYPTIDFRYSGNKTCEVALELNQARGAVWVGDVVCSGLSSWAAVTQTGEENES
ncbi:hypothetical protein FZ563_002392 [Escherichia coli]|nr:hypothetical protein [Escherichia coli]